MEIKNLKIEDHKNIIAKFDLHLTNLSLVLRDLRLIRKSDGGEFIAYPCRKFEKDGETQFYKYYYFTGEKNDAFQKKVKELLMKELPSALETEQEKPPQNEGGLPF